MLRPELINARLAEPEASRLSPTTVSRQHDPQIVLPDHTATEARVSFLCYEMLHTAVRKDRDATIRGPERYRYLAWVYPAPRLVTCEPRENNVGRLQMTIKVKPVFASMHASDLISGLTSHSHSHQPRQ